MRPEPDAMKESELFYAALAIADPQRRDAFLADACKGDPALADHLRGLLEVEGTLGDFLEVPAVAATLLAAPARVAEGVGTLVGPYRLLEAIGEGGMGTVFLAEQTEPVRRRVALKVIKPGMDTRQVIARFEAERQALALMDHPNIARVLDAGTTASGRPYFVMEMVQGLPITEYCDRERLSVPERLELFVLVCRAVQHAHQKGIIHRDIKPSNVMVTVIDGVAVPKVIDFGVAKATGQTLTERTLFTGFYQFVGTPLYMSPEQAAPEGVDVDTRSDIYSLGVLLYELLTGTTPFEAEALKTAGFDEVRRIIREEEPERPSRRLSTLGERPAAASGPRGSDPRRRNRAVRGELDWIAMKALEKDRRRRYETANDLAADVMRYLTGNPVEACAPSVTYRLTTYARRNRVALTTMTLVGLALITGTGVSLWQAGVARTALRQARAERDYARQAQRQAAAVNDFLGQELFLLVDRDRRGDGGLIGNPALTVGEALDRAAERIGDRFRNDPLTEAAVRDMIGWAYKAVGRDTQAIPHFERTVGLRTRLLGPDHPDTVRSAWGLALSYPFAGRCPEAVALLERVLAQRTATLGPDHWLTLRTFNDLGETCRKAGHLDRALAVVSEALRRKTALFGTDAETTINSRHDLGLIYRDLGRHDEAIGLLRQALAGLTACAGPDHPDTLYCLANLTDTISRAGRHDEALQLYRETVERTGAGNPGTALRLTGPWMTRARELLAAGADAEAEQVLRECLEYREWGAPDEWPTFVTRSLLGEALFRRGRLREAGPHLERGYEGIQARPRPAADTQYALRRGEAADRLARYYDATGRPDDARRLRAEAADRPVPP